MKNIINEKKWSNNNGIYVSHETVDTALTANQQDVLYRLEANSWWFKYRSNIIIECLDEYFDKSKLVLDIGGGNGYTASVALGAGYDVCIMEPTYEACCNARKRGVEKIICGALSDENIIDKSVKQAMLLDVLEHVEDDVSFLELLRSKLEKNARCLVTVPAFMKLWSSKDVDGGHFRRYEIEELQQLVCACGFKVVFSSYYMGLLYWPIKIGLVWGEKIGLLKPYGERTREEEDKILERQFVQRSGIINWVLHLCEKIEIEKVKKNKKIRKGSSIIMIVEK